MLTPGTRLGPYEVLGPLGSGGMGEVYRARDQRLDREVAIKVLPVQLAAHPEALQRFEREAKAIAALSHSNILAIHDFSTDGGVTFAVMELLDGETLATRLDRGPLSWREAVRYGIQIAEGLAAAHSRGIIHRDLKPENVFVTADGSVKILDFGLARSNRAAPPHEQSRALTTPMVTEPGYVVGTAAYMSPEQVRGLIADARSDIFSLGCVLYEMLSGSRPFARDTSAESMTAILKEEPPDLSEDGRIPPGLPPVIRHCLEKDPDRRFQTARDLAFALEAASGSSTSARLPWRPAAPRARVRRLLVAGAALALLIVLALAAGRLMARRPSPSFHRLTFGRGTVLSARFAPDGETIVYGASWNGQPVRIFSTRSESPVSSPLGLPEAQILSISSSAELAIALRPRMEITSSYSGTLARVPLAGGAPRELLEDVRWADWAPDGSLAVVREVGGKDRLEFPLGKAVDETAGWISHPRVSPQGDLVAFLDHSVRGDFGGSVAVIGRDGRKRVLSSGWLAEGGLAWSRDSSEVWFSATKSEAPPAIYAVSLSGAERLVLRSPGQLDLLDVSRGGRVLMAQENLRAGIVGLLPGEGGERDLSGLDWSILRDMSADGGAILFDESGQGGGPEFSVYLRRAREPQAVRLGDGFAAALSPDGRWALSITKPPASRLVLLPTGAGESRALAEDHIVHHSARFLPDNQRILFAGNAAGGGVRLFLQPVAGGAARPVTPEGIGPTLTPVSPDGRSVVASGKDRRLFLYSLAGGEPREISGTESGDWPIQWSADGRDLFVYRRGELPCRVYRVDTRSGRRELWREIVAPDPAGITAIARVLVTPDARYYAYSYLRVLSDLFLVRDLK